MIDAHGEKSERELVWHFALRSRLCTIYYQRLISRWGWFDLVARVLGAVASSAALVALLASTSLEWPKWLSGIAAFVAITHTSLRVSDRVRQYGVLVSAYVSHYHRFANMFQFGWDTADLRKAIDSFHDTEVAEAKDNPTLSNSTIERAHKQVEREIGMAPSPQVA